MTTAAPASSRTALLTPAAILARLRKSLVDLGLGFDPADLERYPYLDPDRALEDRVELLLQRMSLQERVHQLHGSGQMRAPRNRRLGIPDFRCCDGPRGIGEAVWRYPFRRIG